MNLPSILPRIRQWSADHYHRLIRIGIQRCPHLLLKLSGGYLRFRDEQGAVAVIRYSGQNRMIHAYDPVRLVIIMEDKKHPMPGRQSWIDATAQYVEETDFDEDYPGLRVVHDVEGFLRVARQFFGDLHCFETREEVGV